MAELDQGLYRHRLCKALRQLLLLMALLEKGIEILKRHEQQRAVITTPFHQTIARHRKGLLKTMRTPRFTTALLGLSIGLISLEAGLSAAQAGCNFLPPVGSNGSSNIVKKRVSREKLIGRTNWNTDFAVNAPYSSFKLFFTADSTASGTYPVEAFLKFTDGSNLRVVKESMTPPIGTGKQFGPFTVPQGKQVNQVNFKIGAGSDPNSTGFSYRISVQGCN